MFSLSLSLFSLSPLVVDSSPSSPLDHQLPYVELLLCVRFGAEHLSHTILVLLPANPMEYGKGPFSRQDIEVWKN
jgi:hypothetical protein